MLPIIVQSASVSARSLSVSILGGMLDAIHVSVEGIEGEGDHEEAAKQLLAGMSVNGSRVSRDGSTTPFISGMTGEAFRSVGNTLFGYLRAEDGFIIATGRQVFAAEAGVSVRLGWPVPTVEDVDLSGASIVVRRAAAFSTDPAQPLALYEGQAVTESAMRFTTTVPNLGRAFVIGEGFEKARIEVNGASFEADRAFARAVSGLTYSHEQTEKPALVLWDSDLAVPASPSFVIYGTPGQLLYVQTGQL